MHQLRALPVPLVDLTLQHDHIAMEMLPALLDVMSGGDFIGGAKVTAFETAFAAFCARAHCVGVGNGTDAVEFMLRAAGIGGGDEVIVPANTFVATAAAIVRAGARPVFVDCDPVHHLIDVDSFEEHLSRRTRAIVAVHLYGQMARMEELKLIIGDGALLFEDAAQAQGATRGGSAPGAWGTAAATSFYPGKNLGAYGDGGAVLTDDEMLARRIRALRNHGGEEKDDHGIMGWNSRLDTLQAVVLSAKLRHLPAWNAQRASAAAAYRELLSGHDRITLPSVLPGNEHVWHLFVVRVPDRDRVCAQLRADGIGAGVHYPVPVHLLPSFRSLGYGPGAFPRAEQAASEILSLPIFPGITAKQIERVAEALLLAVAK